MSEIFFWLHGLVSQDIIDSDLDRSPVSCLQVTLTREYVQGDCPMKKYADDAFYPLVVRSLAMLLLRTIKDLGAESGAEQVEGLVRDSRVALSDHYRRLIARRPCSQLKFGEAEDPEVVDKLWSYAKDLPYVFYATQRTLFALMCYADCLKELDRVISRGESTPRGSAVSRLAHILAETLFTPAVEKMVQELAANPPRIASPSSAVSLPQPAWASRTICHWLTEFTADFERAQIPGVLDQRAHQLIKIHQYAEEWKDPPTAKDARRQKIVDGMITGPEGLLQNHKKLLHFPGIGPRLAAQEEPWTAENLVPPLFDYLFDEFMNRSEKSLEDLLDVADEKLLWHVMHEANETCKAIDKWKERKNEE